MSNLVNYMFLRLVFFSFCFGVGVKPESTTRGITKFFAETKTLVHIGVILNFRSPVGSVANACIPMAISDFYAAHPYFRTRLFPHIKDSDDALDAAFTGFSP